MGTSHSAEQILRHGDISDLKELLQNHPNVMGDQELTDVYHSAMTIKNRPTQLLQCAVQLLLNAGVDKDAINKENGRNSLHYACAHGNIAIIPYLIKTCKVAVQRDYHGLLPQDMIPISIINNLQKKYLYQQCVVLLDENVPCQDFSIKFKNILTNRHHESNSPILFRTTCPRNKNNYTAYIQAIVWKENRRNVDHPTYGPYVRLSSQPAPMSKNCQFGANESNYQPEIFEKDPIEKIAEQATTLKSHDNQLRESANSTLFDSNDAYFPTLTIAENSECNFLYIISDKNMMKRRVMASTGPILIKVGVEKYVFRVGAVRIHHSDKDLDGKVFNTLNEFQEYMSEKLENACNNGLKD